jgi:hypothetical protein
MEFFEAIEQLAPVRLLKASFFAYPVVNALHIASIGTLFTSVLLLDLSVLRVVHAPGGDAFMRLMRRLAFVALCSAAVTGAILFSVRAAYYAVLPVFLAKMILIVLAGLNLLVFFSLEKRGASTGLRVSATASLALWTGALVCGRFIGFV